MCLDLIAYWANLNKLRLLLVLNDSLYMITDRKGVMFYSVKIEETFLNKNHYF